MRIQIFAHGEPAKAAYIGGVFKSEMLRERFRLLVELEDGNQVIAPRYGPGVGALIEAYIAARLTRIDFRFRRSREIGRRRVIT